MLKRKSYTILLVVCLLFIDHSFADDIKSIEQECKVAGRNFINKVKSIFKDYSPDDVRIDDVEVKSIPNMEMRIDYTRNKYKIKCKKIVGQHESITVVVGIDEKTTLHRE